VEKERHATPRKGAEVKQYGASISLVFEAQNFDEACARADELVNDIVTGQETIATLEDGPFELKEQK
jgi:hypothetical protein